MSAPLLSHEHFARTPRAICTLMAVYVALFAMWIWLAMAPWIIAIAVFFTLPLVWELGANRRFALTVTQSDISWEEGRRGHTCAFNQIEKFRFDTRLDMSVKVTLILAQGGKIRVPYGAMPPHRTLEAALKDAGQTVERHHFSLIGI